MITIACPQNRLIYFGKDSNPFSIGRINSGSGKTKVINLGEVFSAELMRFLSPGLARTGNNDAAFKSAIEAAIKRERLIAELEAQKKDLPKGAYSK